MISIESILRKALDGERLDPDDGLAILDSHDLLAIARVADRLRARRSAPDIVSYIVDRNINYTNICLARCRFCFFKVAPNDPAGYTLTDDELDEKIIETIELGGSQILLQGALHPTYKIDWYEALFRRIKERHSIALHALSPPEIVNIARLSKISIPATIERLIAAGLDSIPGGGAEILLERVRAKMSPGKCSADEWLDVMRHAHLAGLKTSATMMFGHEETRAERVASLDRLRRAQDQTGGFTAFIPWPMQPGSGALLSRYGSVGAVEYLKMVALARLYLDNFANIQASWVTQGTKVAQMALLYGANDLGSTMIEENVVAAAGAKFSARERELRAIAEEIGRQPRRRAMDYTLLD